MLLTEILYISENVLTIGLEWTQNIIPRLKVQHVWNSLS